MEAIRSFHSEDKSVEIPIDACIRGNLMVVVHHVRAIPVAKKAGIVSTHTYVCTYMYMYYPFSQAQCVHNFYVVGSDKRVYFTELLGLNILISETVAAMGASNMLCTYMYMYMYNVHVLTSSYMIYYYAH